jgi:predicted membrane protein
LLFFAVVAISCSVEDVQDRPLYKRFSCLTAQHLVLLMFFSPTNAAAQAFYMEICNTVVM